MTTCLPSFLCFFTMGDALRVVKDGADNLRFILGADDSEAYQGSAWESGPG